MKISFTHLTFIATMLCISLIFSCSSEDTTNSSDFVEDPNAPEIKVSVACLPRYPDNTPPLGGIFNYFDPPWWFSDAAVARGTQLFLPGNVAEILPIPEYLTNSDSIRIHYPASVGTLFDVALNIYFTTDDILLNCGTGCKTKDGKQLTANNIAEGITIYANVHYHPNAYRELFISCTDQIFQGRPDQSGNNCLSNKYNFYLAWALQYNNGKYVEAGTYVATTKFYWQIEYIDPNGILKTQKFNSTEFKEKFTIRECVNPEEPRINQ